MMPLNIPSCDECQVVAEQEQEIAELKAQIADLEERLGTRRPGVPIGEALFAMVGGGPLKWANMPEHEKGEWTRASGRVHSLGYESGMRKSRERIAELEEQLAEARDPASRLGPGRPANGSPIQRITEILDEHCDGDGRSLEARVTELIVDLRNTRSFASSREFAGYRDGVRDTLRGMYGGGE